MTDWLRFRTESPGVDCRNCDVLIERGEDEELHPACAAGRCTDPVAEGGLGVVALHPLNVLALSLYQACQRLGPELAWRVVDPSGHPDRPLLRRQLEALVEEWGAAWVGMGIVPKTDEQKTEETGAS